MIPQTVINTTVISSTPSASHMRVLVHCKSVPRFRSYSSTPLKPHSAPFPARTHNCGVLTAADVGSRVVLTGWLLPERKGGKLLSFYPLQDSFGTTQLVVNHSSDRSSLSDIPTESAVLIEGTVVARPQAARRPGPTGDIDVHVDRHILLNPADANLPFFPLSGRTLPNDELRARFRYLDLRRPSLSSNLRTRSRVSHLVRNSLHELDFTEVETPVLLRSSPEGAREFLVPTRLATAVDEPRFFALPQSPQQPKQLLICSGGVDKYFQIAKCFRDEDGRKDRQPEFTQIDLEMAFVSWGKASESTDGWRIGGGEVRTVVEMLVKKIWKEVLDIQLETTFRVMTYSEAMKRYGSDKPDTRFGLEIVDVTRFLPSDVRSALEAEDQVLECIPVRQSMESELMHAARKCEFSSPVRRVVFTEKNASQWLAGTAGQDDSVNQELGLQAGDVLWTCISPKTPSGGSTLLGQVRLQMSELAQASGRLVLDAQPHFLWITEFPLFTRADGDKEFLAQGRWSSSHHPFTAPMWEDIAAMYAGDIAQASLVAVCGHATLIARSGAGAALRSGLEWDR
ncbi:unnamed protein product, partial [Mycena citricolor]